MCRVAHRYHKSPFDPDFLAQWENYEQRILLEASLEIDFDVDIIAKALDQHLPELMTNLTDILGTNIVNMWAKKPQKHIINRDKDKDKEAIGNKIYLPNGQVINIGAKPKE
jgi:hypothetical protein